MAKDQPRTGDGRKGGRMPRVLELFMRRSSEDNKGVVGDVQSLATARFRKAAGGKESKQQRKAKWFRG